MRLANLNRFDKTWSGLVVHSIENSIHSITCKRSKKLLAKIDYKKQTIELFVELNSKKINRIDRQANKMVNQKINKMEYYL